MAAKPLKPKGGIEAGAIERMNKDAPILAIVLLALASSARAQSDSFRYDPYKATRAQDEQQSIVRMADCVADNVSDGMVVYKSRDKVRAWIAKKCTSELVGMGYMSKTQARCLSDRVTDREMDARLATQ